MSAIQTERLLPYPSTGTKKAALGCAKGSDIELLRQWIGLVAYYAMDRTDELFPGPDN
jgi:hypothetical protein